MKLPKLDVKREWERFKTNPHNRRKWFWLLLVPITLLTDIKNSIVFVVLMSLYANIESSAAAEEGFENNRSGKVKRIIKGAKNAISR